MNEGVHVEIFHDGHGRYLLFVLILLLNHVIFRVLPSGICLVHGLAAVSSFHLSGILYGSFRKHLAFLIRKTQLTSLCSGFERAAYLSPRLESLLFLSFFPLSLLFLDTLLLSFVETS